MIERCDDRLAMRDELAAMLAQIAGGIAVMLGTSSTWSTSETRTCGVRRPAFPVKRARGASGA